MKNEFCKRCGAPTEAGLIFCKHCGTALRPPVTLFPPLKQDLEGSPKSERTAKSILIVFTLCAVFDFVREYIRERSTSAAMAAVLVGLFGTAFYALLFGAWRNSDK